MHMWTCYIISMPSGGLVPNQSRKQCVTSALGVSYLTANRTTIQDIERLVEKSEHDGFSAS
jgi:hypothetical protein